MPNSADSRKLPPPASSPQDCAVGPTDSELSDRSNFVFWGHGSCNDPANAQTRTSTGGDTNGNNDGHSSKKRKHCGGDCGEHDDNATKAKNSSFQRAIGTFLSSGCCVTNMPVLPPHFVQTCLDRAKTDYRFLKGKMEKEREKILHDSGESNHHRMVALTRQDYAEWVARDGGRVDIRYGLSQYPYNCGGLIYNSIVFPLVKALLNGEENLETEEPVQLLYAGVMWGMPIGGIKTKEDDPSSCCHHQKWHADGGHLFSPHQLPEGLTLPPHCINVFYPLVDLTKDNGPTEFRIESHRRDGTTTSDVEFPLLCPAGSAVLFDYRIQHRGRANLLEQAAAPSPTVDSSRDTEPLDIDKARPVLYLAYAKTYFKDHGNTRSGRRLVRSGNASLWATRTLEGRPVPYGKGFENYGLKKNGNSNGNNDGQHERDRNEGYAATDDREKAVTIAQDEATPPHIAASSEETPTTATDNNDGVGERWILFQMTLELPDGKSEILKVHNGDVAVEVAQQFCFKHGLQDDFVSVLTQAIQGQMGVV